LMPHAAVASAIATSAAQMHRRNIGRC
jgi:hypothetical protein